jgi:aspartyl aminopeptidase
MNETAKRLCDFLDASPTSFHAVDNLRSQLLAHGAIVLSEKDEWQLEPGVTYFVSRGDSSLIAFRPGVQPLMRAGYRLACAHTDSPALKVRTWNCEEDLGMLRVPVDVYGDAILSTWLDRPLALAGQVFFHKDGKLVSALYNSNRPVGVIPNLAIHLNREMNRGVEYNVAQHLPTLVGVTVTGSGEAQAWLKNLVAQDLGIEPTSLYDLDLSFYDYEKAVVFGAAGAQGPILDSGDSNGGVNEGELINSSRLDDLCACHAILEAFCAAKGALHTQLACFFDAEEIGSMTPQGANSNFLRDILARISIANREPAEGFYRAGAMSVCLSCDVAQAWNPAYAEKYDSSTTPVLGRGVALKRNISQRYGTSAATGARFARLCEAAGVKYQSYMVKADMQSGRTIGPMIAERLGVRTIDIGHPLLSMHSIRETIHAQDHIAMEAVVHQFFDEAGGFLAD